MTNSKDKFYMIRASLLRKSDQEVWRAVLVPSSFSLLQFHVVLQDLFGWKETSGSFHYFSHGKMEHKVYLEEEIFYQHRNFHDCPEIVYQTIYPEECDGWVKRIGPGLYIEHTHPHDPAPLFTVNHELAVTNDELTTRILRDERLYKIHHVFDLFPHLFYEFDHGLDSVPSFRLLLSFEETIISAPDDFSTDYSLFPVIIDGQGECALPFEKQEVFQLNSMQKRLNCSHTEYKQGDVNKCYLCHRF
ncbi:hypothetical protein K493DRAFT_297179 [Basidiobolus meristosporus CBS 931.73]|nr:hypothetical protein K493DRAFT_297179 [Basidiobolus meristosporus CBS 931.73]|eukprot:ORY04097.1 hypothetical protein K493DRAFT_297179 [Basidiobolus meristosporus CBS 931.73]